MPLSTVFTKIPLTMLCLSAFELYSRWVPLIPPPKKLQHSPANPASYGGETAVFSASKK